MKKAYHTVEVKGRKVTIVAAESNTVNGVVELGYSVCVPEDTFNEELSRKISLGRARSDNRMGKVLLRMPLELKSYGILKAIAVSTANAILEDPSIIRGIRDDKTTSKVVPTGKNEEETE